MKKILSLTTVVLLLFVTIISAQQNLPFLRVSPQAKVSQSVGFASIDIEYSRPGVKGREIFGELVPYGLAPNNFGNGKPMPWRMGANELTTIQLSHDAEIGGKKIPAGKYGLHAIVQENEWTLIFNTDNFAWGSFFYEKENDIARIKVKPTTAPFAEWLTFGFDNLDGSQCDAYLHWGEVKVPFTITFDNHKIVLDTYRTHLQERAGFNQAAWAAAARYCVQNNINMEEGKQWIEKALSMNNGNTFANNAVKAAFLEAEGKSAEAEKIIKESIGDATENELNNYGYQLMGQNKLDEALQIFKSNIDKNPDSWNVYDSYAEALNNKGDKKKSKEYYEKAYDMAPAAQKARIEGILKTL